jgi:hypothetical protein
MRKALINAVVFPALAAAVALAIFCFVRRRRRLRGRSRGRSVLPSHGGGARADRFQAGGASGGYAAGGGEEALMRFPGGEALTVAAILEAPGEVVAKSSHSTLYRAGLSAGELYIGPRGEKLLVHPFYAAGSLRRLLQGLLSVSPSRHRLFSTQTCFE